jgi:AbrB family looped-hinge helix DNA binding protein
MWGGSNESGCHVRMVMALLNGMKETLIPIDQAGRIVLPKDVRQELAIQAGDTFKVSIQGTAVTLTPHKQSAGFVRRGKALVFSTSGDEVLSQDMANAVLRESIARGCVGGNSRRHDL